MEEVTEMETSQSETIKDNSRSTRLKLMKTTKESPFFNFTSESTSSNPILEDFIIKEKPILENLTKPYTKILVVGDAGIGKSWFCCAFANEILPFQEDNVLTKDYLTSVKIDKKDHLCLLCDSESPSIHQTLPPRLPDYKETDVVLLCFAIDDKDSLSSVTDRWITQIKKHCGNVVTILVGLKRDLRGWSNGNCWQPDEEKYKDKPVEAVSRKEAEVVKDTLGLFHYMECSSWKFEGITNIVKTSVIQSLKSGLKEKIVRKST